MDYPLAERLCLGNQAPGMGLPAPKWVEILPFPTDRAGPFPTTVPFAPLPGRIGTLATGKNPPLSAIMDLGAIPLFDSARFTRHYIADS